LETLQSLPEYLHYLLNLIDTSACNFHLKIHEYNSTLAFTSAKYQLDNWPEVQGSGIICFQIHGVLYHLQGPLQTYNDTALAFAQLYFYDPAYAVQVQCAVHLRLDSNVLLNITTMLHEINPYISIYKTIRKHSENIL
ncbi:hypothetical protein L873DRAFT_1928068, partial [Choiromyces venosus 120613-1]